MTFEDEKWYVVHTYSGYENKVASSIKKVVENHHMQDQILDVKVPCETVREVRMVTKKTAGGEKVKVPEEKEIERKLFPGYVFVKFAVYYDEKFGGLKMTDEAWYIVRNTRGCTGFVGPESKPVPLTEKEVVTMGVEKRTVSLNYEVGDLVTVVGGPFDGFSGTVDSIDAENNVVKVIISMMGRPTPLELALDEVEIPE